MDVHLPGDTYEVVSRWYAGQGDPLYRVMSRFATHDYDWDDSGTHFIMDVDEDEIAALGRLAGLDIPNSQNADDEDLSWAGDYADLRRRFPPVAPNPRRQAEPDENAANELAVYIENEEPLRRQATAIEHALLRKVARGTFNFEKSIDAWQYLADAGAKAYTRAFPGPHRTNYGIFDPATRRLVAKTIAVEWWRETLFLMPEEAPLSRNSQDFD